MDSTRTTEKGLLLQLEQLAKVAVNYKMDAEFIAFIRAEMESTLHNIAKLRAQKELEKAKRKKKGSVAKNE